MSRGGGAGVHRDFRSARQKNVTVHGPFQVADLMDVVILSVAKDLVKEKPNGWRFFAFGSE
jgi:hypothetical protein